MRSSFSSTAALVVASGLLCFAGSAGAAVEFQTGNIQYTNVNIVSDQDAFTITAHVDALPVHVYFDGYGAGPAYPATMLHGQHGVAFVEAFNPLDDLFRLTMTAETGYAFLNIDWKLDAKPPVNGLVTFAAFDAGGVQIPLGAGTDTFLFDHNGQNPFHVHADAGTPISMLMITSTVPILDIKQVSVDFVPAPGAAAVMGLGALLMGRRQRR